MEDAKATMALYFLQRPFDREKVAADHQASLTAPQETVIQHGNRLVLTAAAYAPLDLGRGYHDDCGRDRRRDDDGKGVKKGTGKNGVGK